MADSAPSSRYSIFLIQPLAHTANAGPWALLVIMSFSSSTIRECACFWSCSIEDLVKRLVLNVSCSVHCSLTLTWLGSNFQHTCSLAVSPTHCSFLAATVSALYFSLDLLCWLKPSGSHMTIKTSFIYIYIFFLNFFFFWTSLFSSPPPSNHTAWNCKWNKVELTYERKIHSHKCRALLDVTSIRRYCRYCVKWCAIKHKFTNSHTQTHTNTRKGDAHPQMQHGLKSKLLTGSVYIFKKNVRWQPLHNFLCRRLVLLKLRNFTWDFVWVLLPSTDCTVTV